ncbi:MAG: N-acetylglutamate synthase [Methylothermaceae bacteria B42]|nr:MAG: N-acetylglutamate synthase [Methylothermaceae bacteria B42]HHJ39608.1 amino-acid N-acetyltransferase [Methylothermaceae bacterium]
MPAMTDINHYVRWFRSSSPYIHAHRGKTFVVMFGGEALLDDNFSHLIHDLALLHGLGIRLVLVHGLRPQIEARLKHKGIACHYHPSGLRITDAPALECVKEAAGVARVEIEALFSLGIAESPMAGLRLLTTSGNFVLAKPLGVLEGIDLQHTGEVRGVKNEALQNQLNDGNIVVLSPLGYSPTGEVFNLRAEEVATAVAGALKADKLLILTEGPCQVQSTSQMPSHLTDNEAEALLEQDAFTPDIADHVRAAVSAIRRSVGRVHLIDRHMDGALLLELFTREGQGTLISAEPFEQLRPAHLEDIGGILELIEPLEQEGILVKRPREKLEMEIDDFIVIERDGLIIGCAALHTFPQQHAGELACLALHSEYRGQQRGLRLLNHIENLAREKGLKQLFLLTTRTTHWFIEKGFQLADFDQLPLQRRQCLNYKRNSKVLIKWLT